MTSTRSEAAGSQQQQQHVGQGEQHLYEELAQLLSASLADMNAPPASFKREHSITNLATTTSAAAITASSSNSGGFSSAPLSALLSVPASSSNLKPESGTTCGSEAVQQSQVSSSKPSLVGPDLGSLLLEALEGFIFVVNGQGKVEFVSENVTQFLKYTHDDLYGKSIYNVIHVGDHAQFSNTLDPVAWATGVGWSNDSHSKGRNFTCRMLVKPPSEEDDDVELKQISVSQYESMQITAIQQPYKLSEELSDRDSPLCLVCIARRVPMTEKINSLLAIDQFSTKIDLSGVILSFDVRNLGKTYGDVNLTGKIYDFCHSTDLNSLRKHFNEVIKNGTDTSSVYRFRLHEGRFVFIQTKSKHFSVNGQDCIFSTHTIIRECDSDAELKGSASTCLMKSIISQSGNSRSSHGLSLSELTSAPTMGGGLNLASMFSMSNPSVQMNAGGMGQGGSMGPLLSTPMGNGNNNGSSMDLLDLEFLNTEGDSSSGGLLGGDGGLFNGDMGGLNFSVSQQGYQPVSSAASWSGVMSSMKTSTPTSLQSVLLGNQPMGNLSSSHNLQSGGLNNAGRRNNPSSFDRSDATAAPKMARMTPSPGTNVPRNTGGFNIPRGGISYQNQRSPGTASSGGGLQNRNTAGQFVMGYRKGPVSPLVSPQQGIPQSPGGWGRSPNPVSGTNDYGGSGGPPSAGSFRSQPSPLQALQSMDSNQNSAGHDLLSPSPMGSGGGGGAGGSGGRSHGEQALPPSTPPYSTPSPSLSLASSISEVRGGQNRKLCILLTQSSPLDPMGPLRSPASSAVTTSSAAAPRLTTVKSSHLAMSSPGRSSAPRSTGAVASMKSPDDSLRQSPTPGPGTSPPEKPQSTSNEDGESLPGLGEGGDKKDNFILKKLLSQDEDGEPPTIMDHEVSSSPSVPSSSMDRNEAEPKKIPNVLLKQLLSEENRKDQIELQNKLNILGQIDSPSEIPPPASSRESLRPQELLQQLLHDDSDSITCAPAESTSEDINGSRSRNPSGQQEPQSTTASLPLTPSPSHVNHRPQTSMGLMQELYGIRSSPGSSVSTSINISNAKKNDAILHRFLEDLWDNADSKDQQLPKPQQNQHQQLTSPSAGPGGMTPGFSTSNRKRKTSGGDNSELLEAEPSTSSSSSATKSKLSQQNALLAQLLSKRAAKETVVNTQLTVNPTGVPQPRIPRNFNSRVLQVKAKHDEPSSSVGGDASCGSGAMVSSSNGPSSVPPAMGTSSNKSSGANIHSNPLTDPNAPFPGNTSVPSNPDSTGNLSGVFDELAEDQSQTQFSEQVSQFMSEFEGPGSDSSNLRSEETDPLLQQILQQAASLEQDIFEKKVSSQWPMEGMATSNITNPPSGPPTVTSTQQQQPQMPMMTPNNQALQVPMSDGLRVSLPGPPAPGNLLPQQSFSLTPLEQAGLMDDDQNVLMQLEQILAGEEGLSAELLNLVSSSTAASPPVSGMGQGQPGVLNNNYNEQLAISAIQRQLMNDDPIGSMAAPQPAAPVMVMGNAGPLRSPTGPSGYPSQPPLSPATGMGSRNMMGQPVRHPQMMGQMGMGSRAFPPTQMSPQASALSPVQQQQQQQQTGPMFSPTGMPPTPNPQFQQPGMPRGPLASALQSNQQQQQQQAFAPRSVGGMGPGVGGVGVGVAGSTPSSQVRQTLLKQQQSRQLEKKQRQQQQERQRMMQMQQQQQRLVQSQVPQPPHQFGPRFPMQQSNLSAGMDPVTSPGQFPENLRDLMNTGHAPNVTIPPQGSQFGGLSGRHRSLSGNAAIPSSAPPQAGTGRFQFPGDGQFGSQNQMPMFSPPGQSQVSSAAQQQQQMFQTNRMLQRSMSMNPGRGSPRTSQSPFAGSPDPLLLSPHSMSPNSALRQQQPSQVSPPFSQGNMSSAGYNQPGPPSYSGPPVHSSMTPASQTYDFSDFSDVFGSPLPDSKKMPGDLTMNPSPNSMQQFVKQELRNICSARSEKNMQTQLQQHLHQKQQQQQQQQQQPLSQQQHPPPQVLQHSELEFESHSELPLDILETINDMTKERAASMPCEDVLLKEEDMVERARKEAKARYHQFRALSSSSSNPGSVVAETVPDLDDPEVKATSLFRAQLQTPLQQGSASLAAIPQVVNVVTKEPRPAVDIRPPEPKNSLLQQLLADV